MTMITLGKAARLQESLRRKLATLRLADEILDWLRGEQVI
jgi:hypothetical protein